MFKLRPIVAFIVGTGLLQACSAPPTRQELAVQAVMRVRHSSDQTAATYYQLGKYHQEHGDLELAVTAYTHSIALDGRQLEPRNALGAALAGQGRLDEAKSVLQQLVADYPAIAHPYNNLGYVYFMQGNYSAAVTTLQHALAIDAGYERARNNLDVAQAALASHAEPAAMAPVLAAGTTGTSAAVEAPTLASTLPEPQVSVAVDPALAPQSRIAQERIVPGLNEHLNKPVLQAATEPAPAERLPVPILVATAPPAARAVPGKSSRLEIANGNGVTGMAKLARHMLGLSGIAVSRLTNERPYTQQITKIQYRLGFQRAAKALQDALKGHALMEVANDLSPASDVRLVLGKDAVAHLASIDTLARGPLLAMNQALN